jgi:aminoglycoside phosphotransferase family enzyme/predicted kinase
MNSPAAALQASATLVAALARTLQARVVETHISWVLLAGEHAWKIKKPVRLGFLDFGTLAQRERLCHEELRLNRRLAPTLYLAVEPIGGTPQAPALGDTPAIEVALKMQRFPDGALFSERLAAGSLHGRIVDRLAQRLAAFHRDAPVAPAGSPYGGAAAIGAEFGQLLGDLAARGADVTDLRAWADARRAALHAAFEARLAGGFVREGHGDLHLANLIVLGDDDATAFDGIEFDPALRWIDIQADIAFPVMDFVAHGRRDLAFRFLDHWLAETGDHAGLGVLPVHVVARALVRALVARLRPGSTGPDYLAVARQWCSPPGARLLITHGLSGSGKSHAAAQLLEAVGAIRLRSDVERKRLHGLRPLEVSPPAQRQTLYGVDASRRTFDRLHALADAALRAGWPVIVDAAFLRAAERDAFRDLARSLAVPFAILHCEAPAQVLHERLQARAARGDDPSEADAQVLAMQQRIEQPLRVDERAMALDAADGIAAIARRWLALPADRA